MRDIGTGSPPSTRHPATRITRLLILASLLCGCEPPSTRDAQGRPVGSKVYALYCEGCHGSNGEKDDSGRDLKDAASYSMAEMRRIILNGKGKMPGLQGHLEPDEIDAVIAHVRQLSTRRGER